MKQTPAAMNGEKIDEYLKTLSLTHIAEIYQKEAENAVKTKLKLPGISTQASGGTGPYKD